MHTSITTFRSMNTAQLQKQGVNALQFRSSILLLEEVNTYYWYDNTEFINMQEHLHLLNQFLLLPLQNGVQRTWHNKLRISVYGYWHIDNDIPSVFPQDGSREGRVTQILPLPLPREDREAVSTPSSSNT